MENDWLGKQTTGYKDGLLKEWMVSTSEERADVTKCLRMSGHIPRMFCLERITGLV